jgi:hypothetical protein
VLSNFINSAAQHRQQLCRANKKPPDSSGNFVKITENGGNFGAVKLFSHDVVCVVSVVVRHFLSSSSVLLCSVLMLVHRVLRFSHDR